MSVFRPDLFVQGVEAMPGDCMLEARFAFAGAADMAAGASVVSAACGAFSQAGQLGAFALSARARHAPRLEASAAVRIDDRQLGVLFAAANVDPKSFQCLRNMLGTLAQLDVILAAIHVTARGSGGGRIVHVPPVETANDSVSSPACVATPADFEFVWCDSQFSKSRRVLLEFAGDPPRDLATRISPWLEGWFGLLEMGAFSAPFGLGFETESQRGTITLFDQTSYEISVARYMASEAGFRVLANMLANFSSHQVDRGSVRISRVEVD